MSKKTTETEKPTKIGELRKWLSSHLGFWKWILRGLMLTIKSEKFWYAVLGFLLGVLLVMALIVDGVFGYGLAVFLVVLILALLYTLYKKRVRFGVG